MADTDARTDPREFCMKLVAAARAGVHSAGLVDGLEYAVHRLETDLYGCRNSKRLVEMQKALEYAREHGELPEEP